MAEEASVGLMVWDQDSVGTLMNAFRMLRLGRTVVLYADRDRKFLDLRDDRDWSHLIETCSTQLRLTIQRRVKSESLPSDKAQLALAQGRLL